MLQLLRGIRLSKAILQTFKPISNHKFQSRLFFNLPWRFRFSKMAQKLVDDKVANNKVMVFSKTYCPYCKMAKQVLNQTGVKYELMELDERGDGDAIQDYLLQLTGARSVPRVFIGGKCIGGGSETRALADNNKLVPMLKECGAL